LKPSAGCCRYVRTSSEEWDLDSTDRYKHLTNWCQQVDATSYGKYEVSDADAAR